MPLNRLESNEEILQRAARIYGHVPLRLIFRVTDPLPSYKPDDVSTHRHEPLGPGAPPPNTLPEIKVGDQWVQPSFGKYQVLRISPANAKLVRVWYSFLSERPEATPKAGQMTKVAFQQIAAKCRKVTDKPLRGRNKN